LTIAPGAVIKSLGEGEDCNGTQANLCVSGTLDAVGTRSQPIIFTSENDPVGGSTGTGPPTPGDWQGIDMSDPIGADQISFVQISYAATAFAVGNLDVLSVTNSQFSYDQAAFTVAGTADNDPILGALPCVPPYLSVVDATGDWFGTGGFPGTNLDLLSFLGVFVPADFSSFYGALTSEISESANFSDNTVPWSIYSCPAIAIAALPITPVIFFPTSGSALWPNYAEKS
jgi:hypothetical protein